MPEAWPEGGCFAPPGGLCLAPAGRSTWTVLWPPRKLIIMIDASQSQKLYAMLRLKSWFRAQMKTRGAITMSAAMSRSQRRAYKVSFMLKTLMDRNVALKAEAPEINTNRGFKTLSVQEASSHNS